MAGNDTAGTSDSVDVDALMADIESPTKETAEAAPVEAPAAEPVWDGKQWEFEWNGKKIAPDSQDKARTWMSQGYNYSQRMGELNKTQAQQKAEWDQRQAAFQETQAKLSPYQKVDEYARQNPQWWAKVQQDYAAAQQQAQGITPDIANALKPIQDELGQFKSFLREQQEAKATEEASKHDSALDTEIEGIRKDFPNINLGAVDPANGMTLELRILKHAQSLGTTSFKAAFRDYLHDQLMEQAKANGLEANAKTAELNAKKGILGKTPAPVKGQQTSAYVKGKSYDQLSREALAEFGITA